MKINEELERLLSTEQYRQQARPVGNSGGEGFESLLTQQLRQSDVTAQTDAQMLRALSDPMRLAHIDAAALGGLGAVEGSGEADGDDALIQTLTFGISSTLDGMDKYAASLQSGSATSLKDAWTALQSMNSSISGMRQEMGQLSKPHAELESMLNELEVLSATETFKFNRGDYLPG